MDDFTAQDPLQSVPQAGFVPPVPQPTAPSGTPEIRPGPVISPERGEIEIIPETPEISPELEEHIQAVQRGEIELPGPIDVGTHEGQPVSISPSVPQQPNIVLPLTKDELQSGKKQPINAAFRWLAEWVAWLIKKYPGRAIYRSE